MKLTKTYTELIENDLFLSIWLKQIDRKFFVESVILPFAQLENNNEAIWYYGQINQNCTLNFLQNNSFDYIINNEKTIFQSLSNVPNNSLIFIGLKIIFYKALHTDFPLSLQDKFTRQLELVHAKYIETGFSLGTTIDVNRIIEAQTTSFILVNAKENDEFQIKASGYSKGRLYAFLDVNNNLLSLAPATHSLYENPEIILAPFGTSKAIFNVNNNQSDYYIIHTRR